MTKFCIDCRYITDAHREGFEKCTAPAFSSVDPVTGKSKGAYCASARMTGQACGPDGTLWEKRTAAEEILQRIKETRI